MNIEQEKRLAASFTCPVCGVTNKRTPRINSEQGMWNIHCKNCGKYRIDVSTLHDLVEDWSHRRAGHMPLVAHKIRRRQREDTIPWVGSNWLQEICDGPLEFPSAWEQVENLVIFLAELMKPGAAMFLDSSTCQAAIGAANPAAVGWVLQSAFDKNWIRGNQSKEPAGYFAIVDGSLTLDGWDWYNEIGRHKQSRIAFMAMKFGDDELNTMVDDHFRSAVEETGFKLRLLSDEPEAGLIDNRLRVEIRRSRLLIADLSHHNNGAYWEAGFAEGLGLPVVYTCKKSVLEDIDHKIHFDTRNQLIVSWDLDSPQDAIKNLKATIRNSLPDEAILEEPD